MCRFNMVSTENPQLHMHSDELHSAKKSFSSFFIKFDCKSEKKHFLPSVFVVPKELAKTESQLYITYTCLVSVFYAIVVHPGKERSTIIRVCNKLHTVGTLHIIVQWAKKVSFHPETGPGYPSNDPGGGGQCHWGVRIC